ncbi:MAG: hypothetical protein ORN58_01570, partial [Sediminibacterium sp.]|nr:hypothetical protein [Sediminibacterium sp.]
IFKTNDTLVLLGRNIFQIELKTIANQNRQYISRLDWVTNISGSRDSLYRFIIPDSLQNVVYKLRAINTITNDTSTNTFLIRLNNINFDSLGIIGWGDNQYNQLNRPTGLINIVQFALGNAHTLALKSDGTVVGWGYSSNGQITIPAGLKNVVDIAAGYLHSLALKSDGTIVVWGNNSSSSNAIPFGLSNVVQIAAGENHNLALKSDGLLVPWGFNNYTIPAGLSDVVQISAGYDHNLAIKSDSTVAAWGDNGSGQTDVPSNLRSVIQIAAGGYHSLSLKSDSTIVPWGYSYYYTESKNPIPIGSIKATQIAAGLAHSLALNTDSTVLAWGDNESGQINIPVGLNNVVNIYSGSSAYHNFAIFKLEVKTKVENGTVTNNIFFKRGDSVRITYQANDGYVLDYIVVNGNKIYDSA